MRTARPGGQRPILVTGARGQVGHELLRTLSPLAPLMAIDRARLDLGDSAALVALLRAVRPIAIVNAAAYTAVDQAEDDIEAATAINTHAPRLMALEAARLGASFVHYSTDYVFDGSARRPYRETDDTAPLNVYGRSKRDGEHAILAAGGSAVILRCSWIYGLRGRNFLATVQRLARAGGPLRVVDDQVGSPTWSRYIAEATAAILGRGGLAAEPMREFSGIYHLAADGATSWHGFARAILAATPACADIAVEPIASADYPTRARRPAYSVLDTTRLRERFRLSIPTWQEQLHLALEDQGVPHAAAPSSASMTAS